jgi:hypothetical protein
MVVKWIPVSSIQAKVPLAFASQSIFGSGLQPSPEWIAADSNCFFTNDDITKQI